MILWSYDVANIYIFITTLCFSNAILEDDLSEPWRAGQDSGWPGGIQPDLGPRQNYGLEKHPGALPETYPHDVPSGELT